MHRSDAMKDFMWCQHTYPEDPILKKSILGLVSKKDQSRLNIGLTCPLCAQKTINIDVGLDWSGHVDDHCSFAILLNINI